MALAATTAAGLGADTDGDQINLSPNDVADGSNSADAARLLDGETGTIDGVSWGNASNPWTDASYPMTATIDLGSQTEITAIRYYGGEIPSPADAELRIEGSATGTAGSFTPLATATSPAYDRWSPSLTPDGQTARYVRLVFESMRSRFNIGELAIAGRPVGADPVTTEPATNPSTDPAPTGSSTPGSVPSAATGDEQPQPGPPPQDVVRSHGFGSWPGEHLTQSCRDLHDSYWVQGPQADEVSDPEHPANKAYHTWHPALAVHPDTGEECDFGHEHGWDPTLAPAEVFELSGGWPAFGYVAETMSGHRHEDHVGHKVTVAKFRASIGNGAGSEPLYDAGFECDWLSKIHQGSHSMDAFANHLHEYFLTLRCFDGLNGQGIVDNTVVGTEFSVNVMYTYGLPNEFAEDGCSRDDPSTPDVNETVFAAATVTGPEGQPAPTAHQLTPIGTDSPNNRGFTCANGVIWKDMSEIQQVDLWTQLVEIQANDGTTALTIQPYYIIKNPSRIVAGYDAAAGEQPSEVVRTIDLCYDEAGDRLERGFCTDAPDVKPDWRSPTSPFNGTLRAVNFKSSHVANGNGPEQFCTDPAGRAVQDTPPCEPGHVMQKISAFDNHWNDGRYEYGGRSGNIQGSIWAEDPFGRRFEAAPVGGGEHAPNGVGFEFIIDNREPDDNGDGIPDGANIRAEN